MNFTFIIKGDRLISPGVSFGYGDSNPFLTARGKVCVLARYPSTREWNGLGSSKGYPATWKLYRVEWLAPYSFKVVETLCKLTPGRQWKKAKESLLKMMEKEESA